MLIKRGVNNLDGDLGKLVGMIMENPELVEKIKAMGSSGKDSECSTADSPKDAQVPDEIKTAVPEIRRNTKRNELLRALQSFLSEGRRKNLETMMTIADVLDTMRTK